MREQVPCTHHYILAPPSGPQSEGRCKHCGDVAVFNNSLEISRNPPKTSSWGRDGGTGYNARAKRRKTGG